MLKDRQIEQFDPARAAEFFQGVSDAMRPFPARVGCPAGDVRAYRVGFEAGRDAVLGRRGVTFGDLIDIGLTELR